MRIRSFLLAIPLPCLVVGQSFRSPTPACDSLIIGTLQWAPFSDTALQLHVTNFSTNLFSSPGFLLYDQNADTVAIEQVTFFGLPLESDHLLTIHPGTAIQSGSFFGSLELWTGHYFDQACVKNMTIELCPSNPCILLNPYVINYDVPLTNTTLDWTITDPLNNTVGSGNFYLNGGQQQAQGIACLAPGHYTFHVTHTGLLISPVHYGLTTGAPISQMPEALFVDGGSNDMPFTFFGPCGTGNGIEQAALTHELEWRVEAGQLFVDRKDGKAIGTYLLLNGEGKEVVRGSTARAATSIAITLYAPGVYLLRTADNGTLRFAL